MKYRLIFVIVVSGLFANVMAAGEQFDSTGLIDMRNEATIRSSCYAVGIRLGVSANNIAFSMEQSASQLKNQDEAWKRRKKAKEIYELKNRASYWAKALDKDASRNIPPSQLKQYHDGRLAALERVERAEYKDPWLAVKAWNWCEEGYQFP